MDKPAVILIHGLWMNQWVMRYLGRFFKKAGFTTYYFGYPSRHQSLEANSIALASLIDTLPHKTINLVGHSLGGLICIDYMKRYGSGKIEHCVLLGSPVNGSQVANVMNKYRIGKKLLGICASDLSRSHQSISLDKIGLVIGTGGKGLGRLISSLPFPNDGAVSFVEAKIKGVERQVLLPTSHSTMLFSRPVADAAVYFCQNGDFCE